MALSKDNTQRLLMELATEVCDMNRMNLNVLVQATDQLKKGTNLADRIIAVLKKEIADGL